MNTAASHLQLSTRGCVNLSPILADIDTAGTRRVSRVEENTAADGVELTPA
jgi:hypothetical protein